MVPGVRGYRHLGAGSGRSPAMGSELRGCRYVVTPNPRDFADSESLGVRAMLPGEVLLLLSSDP